MLHKMSHLNQRIIVSSIGLILTVLAIYLSTVPFFRPFFALMMAAVIGVALWEYYHIAETKKFHPLNTIGIVFSVVYVFATFLSTQLPNAETLPEIALLIILAIVFLYFFARGADPFLNLSITIFGIVYLVVPLSCIININYFFPPDSPLDGRWWLLYLLSVSKMTDTGAFFIGKKFGQKRMTPYISPKKTWEGAIGGLIVALMTSLFFYLITNLFFAISPLGISFFQSIWLGALISIAAQFGDLAESLLKRDVGVKDSSYLPGLGGMLDIVDSLVFTVPLVYIFIKITF